MLADIGSSVYVVCRRCIYLIMHNHKNIANIHSRDWMINIFPVTHVSVMSILFRAVEKERIKISREPKSLISCESLRYRKRRPLETPIPLRMPVMAKWAKLATLKQTPILNAMPFILIVRQSRPTSHSRNGAACRQMQTIMDSCMLENHLSFNPLFVYASNISTCFFFAIVHDKVVLLSV